MGRTATTSEIESAINALSEADLIRLEKYAYYRLASIGRASAGNSLDDILQEAVARTLGGDRKWNPESVPFSRFLEGVVKSICSELAERLTFVKNEEPMFESELVGVQAVSSSNPYQWASSANPGPERLTEAKDSVDAIKRAFVDDPIVLELISGLEEGFTGPDIKTVLGISQTELETLMRRLQRRSKKALQ